jgi:hypothetical protein
MRAAPWERVTAGIVVVVVVMVDGMGEIGKR